MIGKAIKNCFPLLFVSVWSLLVFTGIPPAAAQVAPAEMKDFQLKALEQTHLSKLVELNQSISRMEFPFKLSLNRNVGLDPKDLATADPRGLEFVLFNGHKILKFTANYFAAFNPDTLTANQRAGRVLNEVVLPMLKLLPGYFNDTDSFDGFGFEIGYHILKHNPSYAFEGKEILVLVFDRLDGMQYSSVTDDGTRQKILNRSEIYLNGEPLGLALKSSSPIQIEALVHRPAKKNPRSNTRNESTQADVTPVAQTSPAKSSISPKEAVDALRIKYQAELESLGREGAAKFHFVEYSPPAFVLIRDQVALQATLRNPEPFDKDSTSIYKRAARSFDLFLAPRLNWIVSKIPQSPDLGTLDISVVNDLTSAKADKSSEAVEFIFPIRIARQFTASEITNQNLIDAGVVLVNGVRISLNLAQVE